MATATTLIAADANSAYILAYDAARFACTKTSRLRRAAGPGMREVPAGVAIAPGPPAKRTLM